MPQTLKEDVTSSLIEVIGNPREELGDLTQLKEDIRQNGMHTPILACPHPDKEKAKEGKLLLIDGQRRLLCMKELRRYKVNVLLDTNVDPEVVMVSANMHRKSLNALERAKAVKSLMEKKGLKAKDVAKILNMTQGFVSQCLKLLEQPAEIQQAVKKGKLTPTAVREIARIEDPKAKAKVAKKAEGEAIEDVKELVQDALEKENRGTKTKAAQAATGKRRGRPTRKESSRPKVDPDERYKDFNPQPFKRLLNGYLASYHALCMDAEHRPSDHKPPKSLGLKRKAYSEREAGFLEGMYQAFEFQLGLRDDIAMVGLHKLQLPADPMVPKGPKAAFLTKQDAKKDPATPPAKKATAKTKAPTKKKAKKKAKK